MWSSFPVAEAAGAEVAGSDDNENEDEESTRENPKEHRRSIMYNRVKLFM
jgi:hypothetical protein